MKGVNNLKISISGVRGVIGESLTPDLLVRFAESFGTYMGGGTVVVGRDTRTSGEMVLHAVLSGLISSGCRVVNLDIVPVPTVQFTVRKLKASGGIAITASHNPAQWNALKFVRGDGCFLNHYQARELLDIYHQGEYAKVPASEFHAPTRHPAAIDEHIAAIIKHIGKLPERPRRLRAVVDCVNGAGSVMSAKTLKKLGADVITINDKPDGLFPRPPEPLPENLSALCEAVIRHKADIGFAQDADADRLAIVDETGRPIGEDYTLVIGVDSVLRKTPGTVVVNLATSSAIDHIAASYDCRILKSKIGEINVTEMMQDESAVVGGEGNGGVIYPAVNMARDSFTAMTLALHRLHDSGGTLSQLISSYPRYSMVKNTARCPLHLAQETVAHLIKKYKNHQLDLTEGIKIIFDDAWVIVRPSNTEPILRIISEAPTREQAQAINDQFSADVASFIS